MKMDQILRKSLADEGKTGIHKKSFVSSDLEHCKVQIGKSQWHETRVQPNKPKLTNYFEI
jgi:hypothetical protein